MYRSSCVLVILMMALLCQTVFATYRKPPFNGSIFGKRTSTVDGDGSGKALYALCEIASESCSSWFPQPDN